MTMCRWDWRKQQQISNPLRREGATTVVQRKGTQTRRRKGLTPHCRRGTSDEGEQAVQEQAAAVRPLPPPQSGRYEHDRWERWGQRQQRAFNHWKERLSDEVGELSDKLEDRMGRLEEEIANG
jgi:hypothetical protein